MATTHCLQFYRSRWREKVSCLSVPIEMTWQVDCIIVQTLPQIYSFPLFICHRFCAYAQKSVSPDAVNLIDPYEQRKLN